MFALTLLLLQGVASIDPHPLSESQATRLQVVAEGSATVDEAGFYALLENTSQWTDDPSGAVVPDYQRIRQSPDAWRGVRCVIEGTIERVILPRLARGGWENVRGVAVRINHNRPRPTAEDFIIIYLTDPPDWQWKDGLQGIPASAGDPVRIIARFFKTSQFQTQGDTENRPADRPYLVFVGRAISATGLPAQPSATYASDPRSVIVFILVLAMLAFLLWRLRALGRASIDRSTLRVKTEAHRGTDTDPQDTESADLPADPIDALGSLARRHDRGDD